jgi:hypothetical protein
MGRKKNSADPKVIETESAFDRQKYDAYVRISEHEIVTDCDISIGDDEPDSNAHKSNIDDCDMLFEKEDQGHLNGDDTADELFAAGRVVFTNAPPDELLRFCTDVLDQGEMLAGMPLEMAPKPSLKRYRERALNDLFACTQVYPTLRG